ncbi:MAG: hypothetical protein VYD57_14955 [Pseudomonadota bacterium]|nr:hypothetical protein [Pseudomonadota bacterium]
MHLKILLCALALSFVSGCSSDEEESDMSIPQHISYPKKATCYVVYNNEVSESGKIKKETMWSMRGEYDKNSDRVELEYDFRNRILTFHSNQFRFDIVQEWAVENNFQAVSVFRGPAQGVIHALEISSSAAALQTKTKDGLYPFSLLYDGDFVTGLCSVT